MRKFWLLLITLCLALFAGPAGAQVRLDQLLTDPYASAQPSVAGDVAYQLAWSGTASSTTQEAWASSDSAVLTSGRYELHYGSYSGVANALTTYLDSAFSAAKGVLGYDNGGYGQIDVYFYSDPGSSTSGYTYIGDNAIYLNVRGGSDTSSTWLSEYGSTVAHETSHVLFEHKTGMGNLYSPSQVGFYAVTWLTEAIAYYTGDVVYSYGSRYSKNTLGYNLMLASADGANRTSWWGTGYRYQSGWADSLDLIQLESIGKYLTAQGGSDSLARLTSYMGASKDFEGSFMSTYGMYTGQFSTDSGAKVNTLYSKYLNYYLGHY